MTSSWGRGFGGLGDLQLLTILAKTKVHAGTSLEIMERIRVKRRALCVFHDVTVTRKKKKRPPRTTPRTVLPCCRGSISVIGQRPWEKALWSGLMELCVMQIRLMKVGDAWLVSIQPCDPWLMLSATPERLWDSCHIASRQHNQNPDVALSKLSDVCFLTQLIQLESLRLLSWRKLSGRREENPVGGSARSAVKH